MTAVSSPAPGPLQHVPAGDVTMACELLTTLFDERDNMLLRLIETYSQPGGRRHQKAGYKNSQHLIAKPELLKVALITKLQQAAEGGRNVYFGVCPRFGRGGGYDLAWQIRTARCLWADLDHVTVEEAQERLAQTKLPEPSIVVDSGHGVHFYWLLDQPYRIDDAGDPPQILTERIEESGGRKKRRKYFVEDGERIYLDERRHTSRLSPKALHFQDVLAGIAAACGGDHTNDLSRLLRLPGTLNCKDARNGVEPVPARLVSCDPTRRYPLALFEEFATVAKVTEQAKKIAQMPLPQPRKTSSSKADKLAQLVAVSGIADAGSRSEADFAVCCYALRNGIAKEEVWAQAERVGKFAEQGRRYFDLTWENAEYDVRAATFDKLQNRSASKSKRVPHAHDAESNGEVVEGDEGPPTIVVDTETMAVGDTLRQVTNRLLAAGNCFTRADQLVVIHGHRISSILSPPELAGLLNEFVEFYFVNAEAGEYKPFPPAYANTWLNQHVERSRLPIINMVAHNPVYTKDWRLVAPGFDAPSGIFYAGGPVEPRSGTEHLDTLLRDFCFKDDADRTNYLGVLLTALLMPRFIGSKPAVLFNGNQPELGKSILAQIIAILRDGKQAETASYNPNDEEFEKRLGAIVRSGATTIIVDNAKGRGRNPRIESACLERSITDPILSFRLLGQSASIRAENSHIVCITANSADISRDLVTRSVVVNLYHEGDPARRDFAIPDPEGYAHQHRAELLGELIGMVERWLASGQPMAKVHSRFNKQGWGNVVGGILQACGQPDFLANASEAAVLLDETRREFAELVAVLVEHAQGTWTAAELVELCGKRGLMVSDLGEGSPRSLATKLGTLAGRFVGERFSLDDGVEAVFHRSDGRKGKVYRVSVEDEVPNLEGFAEPCRTSEMP